MTQNSLKDNKTVIVHGRGSKVLAEGISKHLGVGIIKHEIGEFPDGETFVTIGDNIRGMNVIYVGSSPNTPAGLKPNDVVMEYVYAGDALIRSKVNQFSFFIPYMPFARQDRTKGDRIALTSKRAIDTIMQVNPRGVLLVEPHTEYLEQAFPSNNPPDILWFTNLFACNVADTARKLQLDPNRLVAIAADHGAKVRVTQLTNLVRNIYKTEINPNFGIAEKNRTGAESVELMSFTSGDSLKGALGILPDDIIASGSTMVQSAAAAKEMGASAVLAMASHALLTRGSDNLPKILHELNKTDSALDGLVITSTLSIPKSIRHHPRVWIINPAQYAALAIHNAWGVELPGSDGNHNGSIRGLNKGTHEHLTPQAMPRRLQHLLLAKLAA